MSVQLIDSHVHLQAEAFDEDRDQVVQRAADAGVAVFVCNGSVPADWQAVSDLAASDRRVCPFLGLHPWYVNEHKGTDWLAVLGGRLEETRSGVGEIGLDRWIEGFDIEAQVEAFRAQLGLARAIGRPVTIHCLRAWGLLLEELRQAPPLPAGFIVHAFGGSADIVRPLVDLGAYFSFAGGILDPKRSRAQEALLRVPSHRLLIETDSPDIPPPPELRVPGRTLPDGAYRNEPANLPAILECIAGLRHEPVEALARQLWENGQVLLKGLL